MVRVTSSCALALCLLVGASAAHGQAIDVGPYHFADETPFADAATYMPTPSSELNRWDPWLDATGVPGDERYLIGWSPSQGLINLGFASHRKCDGPCPPLRELLDFEFTDVIAVNGPGPDIVIFDCRYSSDIYEVAVQPRGGALTGFLFHAIADQVATGHPCQGAGGLWGVEIELGRYGIPMGVEVPLVRVAGDPRTNPEGLSEADPTGAAVLNAACPCDDGIECTFDCAGAPGMCVSTPHDPGTRCSAGVCDGAGACVECIADADCRGERPRCDTTANVCVPCLLNEDCDDGEECSTDRCEAHACVYIPALAGAPCTDGMCNGQPEAACVACLEDAHCDDRAECTLDTCIDGACVSTPLEAGTACEDGVCNGAPSAPDCVPCARDADCGEFTPICSETGECVACREDADCPANECARAATCAEAACEYTAVPRGSGCTRGICDGAEPVPSCVECFGDTHCDDGDLCTTDVCTEGVCGHTASCADAGTDVDAGADPPPPAGCGCRAAASQPTAWLLALVPVFVLLVRRRPRSAAPR